MERVKIGNIKPRTERSFGCQTFQASFNDFRPFPQKIKIISTSYPWNIPPNAIFISLVSYALVCWIVLVFSLWHIRGLYTCIQAILLKHGMCGDTVC